MRPNDRLEPSDDTEAKLDRLIALVDRLPTHSDWLRVTAACVAVFCAVVIAAAVTVIVCGGRL